MTEHYDGPERRQVVSFTKEDLREAVEQAIQNHVDSDSHQWIKTQIEKERRKQELWEKAKAQALGTGVIALGTYFLTLFWHDIVRLITRQ